MSPRLGTGAGKKSHRATNVTSRAANGEGLPADTPIDAKKKKKRAKIHPLSGAALAVILTAPVLILGLQRWPSVKIQAGGTHSQNSGPQGHADSIQAAGKGSHGSQGAQAGQGAHQPAKAPKPAKVPKAPKVPKPAKPASRTARRNRHRARPPTAGPTPPRRPPLPLR